MTNQLEKHVTSSEMSQRLKEAGVDLDTPFYYGRVYPSHPLMEVKVAQSGYGFKGSTLKAYDFQTLFEELLDVCDGEELHLMYGDNIRSKELFINDELFSTSSWSDAAGEALLWCLENGHLKL